MTRHSREILTNMKKRIGSISLMTAEKKNMFPILPIIELFLNKVKTDEFKTNKMVCLLKSPQGTQKLSSLKSLII